MKRRARMGGILGLACALALCGGSLWTVGRTFLRQRATYDLAVAVYKDSTDDALAALRAGADPNTRLRPTDKPPTLTKKLTLLWQRLRGAPMPTQTEPEHCPPMIALAASKNNTEIVQALLAKGAKPDTFARHEDRYDNDDGDTTDGETALMWAAYHGNLPMTKALLQRGANVNFAGESVGEAPLLLAQDPAVVEMLLAHSADVNCQLQHSQNSGSPPLLCRILDLVLAPDDGSRQQSLRCMELLLAHGASLNDYGEATRTPLMVAAMHGTPADVRLLLSHGADPNLAGYDDETPLANAAADGRTENLKLLLAHGANPNQRDTYGRTPLFDAVDHGADEPVRILIRAGATVNVKDKEGKTPLQLAEEDEDGGNDSVEDILRAAGAKDY